MNTSINTEEQVTVRNHNRSTALERSVLKYCGVYVWRGGGGIKPVLRYTGIVLRLYRHPE